ncbi:uncharacterized protein LOC110254053 [Exaiptasia diaphana]|uniref:LITAF domain-containing protein n=1 Tax=Exaiptasia diaphana TaxID=2652724 RepID=A0A913YA59_EXADI|nr:uncharacterized protein LOC110254053 [Exaiptasia diaphana]KXJ21464.1 hypothetical protein AC249_AIPGENE761 [Exaiptasia diaphana]
MSRDALVAVREQRTQIGNLDITKKTAIVATNEGVIAYEQNIIHQSQPLPYRGYGRPAIPGSSVSPAIAYRPSTPEPKNCCDYCCCECDSNFEWYNLEGKGCFMVILLLLMYLVIGAVCLPFLIICGFLYCICRKDD